MVLTRHPYKSIGKLLAVRVHIKLHPDFAHGMGCRIGWECMYKKYKSLTGKTYIYENISNNIYELENEGLAAKLPEVGETLLLKCIDKDFYYDIYSKCDFTSLYKSNDFVEGMSCPEVLVIELTQQCNLRCEYCVYSGVYYFERVHNNATISLETIDTIIAKWFSSTNHPKNVSFYGGEPLLKFELISYFVTTLKSMAIDIGYYITTNGILLENDEICNFLVHHDFHVNISYDGLNQNLYRKDLSKKGTASRIEKVIQELMRKFPSFVETNVRLSVTLAPPYHLMENAGYFETHPIFSKLTLMINTVNQDDNSFIEKFDMHTENVKLSDDYHQLANRYILDEPQASSKFLQALFARSLNRIDGREMCFPMKNVRLGCCDPGKQRIFVTCHGDCFMCERVGNFGKLGNVNTGINFNISIELQKEIDKLIKLLCSKCYLNRICDYCFSTFREGTQFSGTGTERIKKLCEAQRKWFDLIFFIYLSKKEREALNLK